jgi:hypothetical protein
MLIIKFFHPYSDIPFFKNFENIKIGKLIKIKYVLKYFSL